MFSIINKFRALPIVFLLITFSSISLSCYSADEYLFSDYLSRIDKIVKNREEAPKSIYKKQWDILIDHEDDIRPLELKEGKRDYLNYHQKRYDFDHGGIRRVLIKEWEKETKCDWPKYNCNDCCRKKGSCRHHFFEAHHVIPLGYNGSNEWWNIFPLTREEHTGKNGIHSSEEARAWFSKVIKPITTD